MLFVNMRFCTCTIVHTEFSPLVSSRTYASFHLDIVVLSLGSSSDSYDAVGFLLGDRRLGLMT